MSTWDSQQHHTLGEGPSGRGAVSLMLAGSKILISSRKLELTMAAKTAVSLVWGQTPAKAPDVNSTASPARVGVRPSPERALQEAGSRGLSPRVQMRPLSWGHLPAHAEALGSLRRFLPGVCVRGSCPWPRRDPHRGANSFTRRGFCTICAHGSPVKKANHFSVLLGN